MVVVAVFAEEVLSGICGMGSGIVLLPNPWFGAVFGDDCWQEAIAEYLLVDVGGDVASNDEGADKAIMTDGAVDMERGWVSVGADRLDIVFGGRPSSVVVRYVDKLTRHHRAV